MSEEEELAEMAANLKTLLRAVEIFETFIEEEQAMLEAGDIEDGQEAAAKDMQERLEDAKETAEHLTVAMTLTLAERGMVPNLDEDVGVDEGEGDDGRSMYY